MKSIWVSEIVFKPAGAMTFRQMPSGILHIMSYPFMPPTTMSGFLKRLLDIAEGKEWAGYGEDWYKGPGSKEFTLTLDKNYRALGAFPEPEQWVVHKTRRHGPKNFEHVEFSQMLRLHQKKREDGKKEKKQDYQLHHWDYLFCESLKGWVAAKEKKLLENLQSLTNFGGKTGKEGYVFVSKVTEPRQLELSTGKFKPLGLVTLPYRPLSGTFYNLYGHYWNNDYKWSNGEKGGVDGFVQIGAWWNADTVTGHYWASDDGIGFPVNSPDVFLQGDREPFYGEAK